MLVLVLRNLMGFLIVAPFVVVIILMVNIFPRRELGISTGDLFTLWTRLQ